MTVLCSSYPREAAYIKLLSSNETTVILHYKSYCGPQTKTDVVINVSDEYTASIYMVEV
jgi:hypothetical protein